MEQQSTDQKRKLTRPQDSPTHLAGILLEMILDLVLRLEMQDWSGILPAFLVTSALYAAVDEVLHVCLDSLIHHSLALLDLAIVGHALANGDLHTVHAP